MDNGNIIRETIQEFCHRWFELRDPEGAARFLTEDIDFVGTGNNEFARGIDEMREYLHQDIREIPEPFVCEWSAIYEQAVTENVYNLSVNMSLKNSTYG